MSRTRERQSPRPQAELVDVVDASDRVLRCATRAEIRRDNLLHRAVYVFVLRTSGDLFVHRRTDTKDVYPGCWDVTVGGVVGAGEDYRLAARRELREEIGIAPRRVRELGPVRYEDGQTRVIGRAFLVRHDGPITLQAEEIVEGRFLPLAEVHRIVTAEPCCPDGVEVLHAYEANLQSE